MNDKEIILRQRSPQETLDLISPYLSIAGITRIADLTGLDPIGLPVFSCIRPMSKSLTTSQGKGLTPSIAKCGACMEAIEHFYAENIKPDYYGSENDKQNSLFEPPSKFMSSIINKTYSKKITIGWNRATNLLDNTSSYIPHEVVSLDLSKVKETSCRVSTTGLASGNNQNEALYYSLLENIERVSSDYFFKSNINEINNNKIDIRTINSKSIVNLIKKIEKCNVDIAIFDIKKISSVPTYICYISSKEISSHYNCFYGVSSSLDSDSALINAVSEAIQSKVTSIASSRDDLPYKKNDKLSIINPSNGSKVYTRKVINFKHFNQLNQMLISEISNEFNKKIYFVKLNSDNDVFSVVKTIFCE